LKTELARDMALLGVASLRDIDSSLIQKVGAG
jgi:hypothetical protein